MWSQFGRRRNQAGDRSYLAAFSQRGRPGRVRRIGFLRGTVPTLISAFEEELRRLGYLDGRAVLVEKRISRPSGREILAGRRLCGLVGSGPGPVLRFEVKRAP
jgi:hypothetical protein